MISENHLYNFENGYTASISRGPHTGGSSLGLYEFAILVDGELCYDTWITDETVGCLNWNEAMNLVKQVGLLDRKSLSY